MFEKAPQTVQAVRDFESFYRREYAGVATVAMVLSRNPAAAEDLAQEAFLRAHRLWDEVGLYERPEGWVRRVVINLAMSRFRRLRAEAKALARLGLPRSEVPELVAQDQHFWTAVRKLPRRQAQVVALHYLEDRSVTDIASLLEVSEGSVKTHLHRARHALADKLDLAGEPE